MITNFKNQIAFLIKAEPWQLGFQDPATPVMEGIINFHHDLMFFLIIVTVFVCWLLFRMGLPSSKPFKIIYKLKVFDEEKLINLDFILSFLGILCYLSYLSILFDIDLIPVAYCSNVDSDDVSMSDSSVEDIVTTYIDHMNRNMNIIRQFPYTNDCSSPFTTIDMNQIDTITRALNLEDRHILNQVNSSLDFISVRNTLYSDDFNLSTFDYLDLFDNLDSNINNLLKLKYNSYISYTNTFQFNYQNTYSNTYNPRTTNSDLIIPNVCFENIIQYIPINDTRLNEHTYSTLNLHHSLMNVKALIHSNINSINAITDQDIPIFDIEDNINLDFSRTPFVNLDYNDLNIRPFTVREYFIRELNQPQFNNLRLHRVSSPTNTINITNRGFIITRNR